MAHYDPLTATPPERIEIAREVSRLEEGARWASQTQFEQAKIWRRFNYGLGIPAFVLGLVSGTAVVVDAWPTWVSGGLAALGGVFAGVLTILGAERRADHAGVAANAYRDIQTEARQLLLVDLVRLPAVDDAREVLARLTDRYGEISRTADVPGRTAYTTAAKNIKAGGQTYGVDEA